MMMVDLINIVSKYSKEENYDFTGYLMYKDKAIAEIKDTNFIKSLDDELLPIIMLNKNAGSFEAWLQTRVIDTHRTNSRQVRRRLSVRTEVPKEIVIKARAVSITDNYWLRWTNENITYNEIRGRLSDGLNTIALYGNALESNFKDNIIIYILNDEGIFISFILAKEKGNITLVYKL